jgi:hypothetical protein
MFALKPCVFAATVSLLLCSCASQSTKVSNPPTITVGRFIAAVQSAINPYVKGTGIDSVNSVKLALQTSTENKDSVETDYLVVAAKGDFDKTISKELDVTLKPKSADANALVGDNLDDLTKTLAEAIKGAQSQVQRTYGSGDTQLNTSEIDVQVSFTVTWDGSLGVNKWLLSPISLNASHEYSQKSVQTVTVVFKASP